MMNKYDFIKLYKKYDNKKYDNKKYGMLVQK